MISYKIHNNLLCQLAQNFPIWAYLYETKKGNASREDPRRDGVQTGHWDQSLTDDFFNLQFGSYK